MMNMSEYLQRNVIVSYSVNRIIVYWDHILTLTARYFLSKCFQERSNGLQSNHDGIRAHNHPGVNQALMHTAPSCPIELIQNVYHLRSL